MADVLLWSLVFPPDNVSTAQIMADLATDLQSAGHAVTVLTTVPHYNPDREAERGQPRQHILGPLVQRSAYEGVRVLHVWVPPKPRSAALRLVAWLYFCLCSLLVALLVIPTRAFVIACSPPLEIGLVAAVFKAVKRAYVTYVIEELYPDILISSGVVRSKALIRLLYAEERLVYRLADTLIASAPGIYRKVVAKGVPVGKVRVLENPVDTDEFRPDADLTGLPFADTAGARLVVSYAGNIGPMQGLELLIDAAAMVREKGIRFLVVGSGSRRDELMLYAQRLGADNITWVPHQPVTCMPALYSLSDISVASQVPSIGNDAVPSKVYRIMACERPVMTWTDDDSDLAAVVRRSQGGIVVTSHRAEDIAAALVRLVESPERLGEMGRAGRAYVLANNSRSGYSAEYSALIDRWSGRDG